MKKILFVEDEESLQKVMGEMLEQNDYQMLRALDGEAGISAAKKELPDLILLDLILPKKNGFEVLEALKQDATTKNIPVIVMTNLEGSAEIERALSLGATTYMVKANYKLEEVLAKIQDALEHHL